jgi:hypothetical protein
LFEREAKIVQGDEPVKPGQLRGLIEAVLAAGSTWAGTNKANTP